MSSVDMAVDRLSQLPNELLISILSSTLSMKEAARTSIISKRWKTLWTYFYGFLDFDDDDDDYKLRLNKAFLDSVIRLRSEQIKKECTSNYIGYVNKVLTCHQSIGVPVNMLRISWDLNNESKRFINSWIDFVIKNRVQHFELDVGEFLWKKYSSIYKFTVETLMGSSSRIGFPNLSVLRLSFVDMTDEALAYLLSSNNCPSLRHVYVKSALSLVHVKVVGNLNLKSLEFAHCWMIKDVEICSAINMVSFGFRGRKGTKITFEDVPLLTEASFGGLYWEEVVRVPIAKQLWSILSHLEVLVMDFLDGISYVKFITSQFPKFDRVKRLEVEACNPRAGDLNICVMAMIYGCPRLQKFSLKMINNFYRDPDGDGNGLLRGFGRQDIRYNDPHECLQTVEYIGWDGNKDDLELVTDLLNISVMLDKVTIDPRTAFRSKEEELRVTSFGKEFVINDKKRKEGAREAAEKLRKILPHRVNMVIL